MDAAEERELNMCSSSVEFGNSLVSMRVVLAKIGAAEVKENGARASKKTPVRKRRHRQ
jgi:hypothetical protein